MSSTYYCYYLYSMLAYSPLVSSPLFFYSPVLTWYADLQYSCSLVLFPVLLLLLTSTTTITIAGPTLLSFAYDEIVQLHTLYEIWADDQNLWGTWHHCQPPLHYLYALLFLWCLDAPSSWSNDDWHVSEASTFTCFVIFLWLDDENGCSETAW